MRLKDLESALSSLKGFSKLNAKLEQYQTSPHMAAHMVFSMSNTFEDVENKVVMDLGCGTGILAIAATLMDANFAIGVDIDSDALEIARSNSEEMEVEDRMDFILADVNNFNFHSNFKEGFATGIDTIVMNPPFGTKNKGIDVVFLQKATQIASGAVYSLHKRSTRDFILQKIEEWGLTAEVVAELRWEIPQSYKFHKKKSVDIEVDFIRVDLSNSHTSKPIKDQLS